MKRSRIVVYAAALAVAVLPLFAAGKDSLDKYWQSTGKSYPAGKAFKTAVTWAPGQYVVVGTKTKGKIESVSKQLVVRKESGGWVIETVNIDKKGKETATQMLLKGFDTAVSAKDASKITIGWMKMRDEEGQVTEIGEEQMALFGMIAKASYEKLVVNVSAPKDGGPVEVPAGSFAGTWYTKDSVKMLGMTVETESWYNSAVPVNGLVKYQTTDGKSVSELLSFGFDGKSTF